MNRTALTTFVLALGCAPATGPAPVAAPPAAAPAATVDAKVGIAPPERGVTPNAPFPDITHRELENGFGLRVVERHTHPIIELRLVLRSGSATDGPKPGLAAVAGELLKAGGAGAYSPEKLVQRAEALGADLNVLTDRDSTRISLGVTSGDLDAALEILSSVALKPRFTPVEFQKLRTREVDRVKSSARGSAAWVGAMILFRELFDLPVGVHPYSRYDATQAELGALSLADCRAWHRAHFVPSNASLVVAGDVSPDVVEAAAKKWFGAWKGPEAPGVSFTRPLPPKQVEVYLVDRPGSAQSQIYVGMLGTERTSPDYPALAAANQILGGGVAGRLFADVREKRSLAYSTGSSLSEAANGPVPIILSAGTQTAKTSAAVSALLENLTAIGNQAPLETELEGAVRYLTDNFVFRLETVGSVADLTSQLYVQRLSDDYYDEYREALRKLALPQVTSTAGQLYRRTPVIVVAGDAQVLGAELTKFGPVAVLDPDQGFGLKRSFPAGTTPSAVTTPGAQSPAATAPPATPPPSVPAAPAR